MNYDDSKLQLMRAVYMTFLKELLKRCMQQKKYNKKKAKIKCKNVNAPALKQKT